MSARSHAASTELALRLGAMPVSSVMRGTTLALVLTHEWLDRGRRAGDLSAGEVRLKQAVWEWFAALAPEELEQVRRTAHGRAGARRTAGKQLSLGVA